MDYKSIITQKFPLVVLEMSKNRTPLDVLELHFRQLVEMRYGSKCFMESEKIGRIKDVFEKYYESSSYELTIRQHGIDKFIKFENILYFQEKIEIDRLCRVSRNKSISVLKFKNEIILIDGYHRTLIAMLEDEIGINSILLELN